MLLNMNVINIYIKIQITNLREIIVPAKLSPTTSQTTPTKHEYSMYSVAPQKYRYYNLFKIEVAES